MLVHKPSLSLPSLLLHFTERLYRTTEQRELGIRQLDEPTKRCIYLYIYVILFSHFLEYKKSEYILLPLGATWICAQRMRHKAIEREIQREKKQINSISHMEFMIFYVNCGTRLEYYMRFLWHRYNLQHRECTQKNNTRRWEDEDNMRRTTLEKNYYHFFRLFSFAHALHIKTYPKITSENFLCVYELHRRRRRRRRFSSV